MDALLPQDIATVLRPGALAPELDSKDRALMVKMERIRKSYADMLVSIDARSPPFGAS